MPCNDRQMKIFTLLGTFGFQIIFQMGFRTDDLGSESCDALDRTDVSIGDSSLTYCVLAMSSLVPGYKNIKTINIQRDLQNMVHINRIEKNVK